MPRRSNPFQQLIAMVVELLEDGEEVTESVEFPDPVTGRPREVDILVVRGKLNGQPVRIGIECVDDRASKKKGTKKADVQWVELQHGKHSRVKPTDHVLLVSATGFTWTAGQVAEDLGYRAITPTITKSELANVLNELFHMTIKVAEISLKTATYTADWADGSFRPVKRDGNPCYENHDSSKQFPCIDLYKTLSMHEVAKDLSYFLQEDGFTRDHAATIDNPVYEGERVYLRLTNGDDEVVVPVKRIVVEARVTASTTVKSNPPRPAITTAIRSRLA